MKTQRQEYILQQVDRYGSVKVHDLSEQLECSQVTIRNDIQALEDKGLVKRTHGGAVKVREKESLSVSIEAGNIYKNSESKKRIAIKAAEYIDDGDTIILDDSSVNYYLALELLKYSEKHLVVITNSIVVAAVLSDSPDINVFMTGGQIAGKMPATMGDIAVEVIRRFHANKAFISAHGINFDAGVTSIGSPQMQVKKAILEVSDEINLLVDSSKFGGGYIMVVCPLEKITRIITDDGISDEYRQMAHQKNVDMEIV